MALNPVERLNVFPPELRAKLRERSYSNNLVQTRTPFLRFTTAATMSDLSNKLNIPNKSKFKDYDGYEFFTLGVHGYDKIDYSATDLYGTQSSEGLVVGTTYKQGEQKLVRTFGGLRTDEKAKSYPPPGILSAKVERLRNGNVLRFTVETQCYTQEQLEMLDAVCFVPGMTCVLEWGTQYTTQNGTKPLSQSKILNFKNVQSAKNAIINGGLESRKTFIDKWCAPNEYNYDWAVAHIANIKTRLVDNVYKTTIIAYGKADNIMYISAYATTNALTESQVSALSTSLHNYFKLNGEFTQFCEQATTKGSTIVAESEYRDQIVKFQAPPNPREQRDTVQTSQESGLVNDFGLEDTYFMSMDFFVHIILNQFVKDIINKGLNSSFTLTKGLIKELKDAQRPYDVAGEDNILVGYNSKLRSTSPEVLIIFNQRAREQRAAQPQVKSAIVDILNRNQRESTGVALQGGSARGPGSVDGTIALLQKYKFGQEISNSTESGLTFLGRGVWVNSKAVQSAFLNARTVMEGLETLLRNINAATENYWDLKLFYDDDAQQFRILDDNARTTEVKSEGKIYEFNKRLANDNGDVIGPDVLSIELDTDFPKMLFSQLAVSAINGGTLSGMPQRKDIDFREITSVKDLFTAGPQTLNAPQVAPTPSEPIQPNTNSFIRSVIEGNNAFSRDIKNQLIADASSFEVAFSSGVSSEVATIVRSVFSNPNLLTVAEAQNIKIQLQDALSKGKINQDQSIALTRFFIKRAEAIITRAKAAEEERLVESFRYADNNSIALFVASAAGREEIIKKIRADKDRLIAQLRQQGEASLTPEQQEQIRQRDLERERVAAGGATTRSFGRGGP
jgi:hypothetical protein